MASQHHWQLHALLSIQTFGVTHQFFLVIVWSMTVPGGGLLKPLLDRANSRVEIRF